MARGKKKLAEKEQNSVEIEGDSTANGDSTQEDGKNFLTLLKPVQDSVTKNWQLKLSSFLEEYLVYLRKIGLINFSEAAVIIQNSSNVYVKRLDIMYDWVRKFCMLLSSASNSEEKNSKEGKEKSDKPRKKTKEEIEDEQDLLDLENKQPLPFSHSKKHHIVKFCDYEKDLPLLNINTINKAPIKLGSAVPVYENTKEDMGYKDEFKLHTKLLGNCRLYEDIQDHGYILNNDPDYTGDEMLGGGPMNLDLMGGCDIEKSMRMDELPPPTTEPMENEALPIHEGPPDISDHFDDHVDNDYSMYTPEEDPFIKSATALIIHRKFSSKRSVFSFPKEGKKKKKFKESFHLSFSELLGGMKEDMLSVRLRAKRSERSRILLKFGKERKMKVNEDQELNLDDDDHDDYDGVFDNLRDNNDSGPPPPCPTFEPGQSLNIEEAYSESVRLAKQNLKRDKILEAHRRVAEWHEMIQPTLQLAEKRSQFDVHEYGTKILDKFSDIGQTLRLKDIIEVDDQKDVCRYVLSALMLANTYNVELSKSDPSELSKDCVQLTLLSLVRHHEELDANIGEAAAGTH